MAGGLDRAPHDCGRYGSTIHRRVDGLTHALVGHRRVFSHVGQRQRRGGGHGLNHNVKAIGLKVIKILEADIVRNVYFAGFQRLHAGGLIEQNAVLDTINIFARPPRAGLCFKHKVAFVAAPAVDDKRARAARLLRKSVSPHLLP